jgi:hypothetical protein
MIFTIFLCMNKNKYTKHLQANAPNLVPKYLTTNRLLTQNIIQ